MYIATSSGRLVDLATIKPEEIDIVEIVHALSNLCRFGGHSKQFYSVAQHSVRVAMALPKSLRFVGLMHDATEAYICDLPRPIKEHLKGYSYIEQVVWEAIAQRFDLPEEIPHEVHQVDRVALCTELVELFPNSLDTGRLNMRISPSAMLPYEAPMAPKVARSVFLTLFGKHCSDRSLQEVTYRALHSD